MSSPFLTDAILDNYSTGENRLKLLSCTIYLRMRKTRHINICACAVF